MKKTGFFNSTKSWGGGEKWHYEAALYFLNSGYTVHFFLTENSALHQKLKEYPGMHLHFIKVTGLSFLNPLKVNKLKNGFKKSGIEILLINLSHDLKLAGRAATKACVSKIIYTRGIPVPIKNSALNRYVFSHWLTDVLANSNATAATILQNNSDLFPKSKIKVIYNPLDVEEFSKRPFQPIYSRIGKETIIGNLGRLEKEKNHFFLINLSEVLINKGIEHKILIGGAGSMDSELKELVNAKELSAHFIFSGFLNNVKDLLMSCDIFILPSLWEGFGFVLAEASLCRKPIIAFNTSSIPELVENNKSGFIININNTEDCADKILFLKNNPEIAKEMGENGYALVSERFEKNKIMKELENFISS